MRYLVDTDWAIDYLKGIPKTVELLGGSAPQGLAMSLMTYGEIYEGIFFGRNSPHYKQKFSDFLEGVKLLEPTVTIMQEFAQLRGNLRAQGQLIGDFDILIAATALHHQLTLLTNNRSHFQRI